MPSTARSSLHHLLARVALIASGALACWSGAALAQTAEQLQMLQSLPAAQRDALIKQYGGGAGKGQLGSAAASSNQIVVDKPGLADPKLAAELKITGGEQLLLEIGPLPEMLSGQEATSASSSQQERLTGQALEAAVKQRDLLLKGNPYLLSRGGVLTLPGIKVIPLGGLTEAEVGTRLAAEPALRNFVTGVKILRVDARGVEALKPFGYDMFKGASTALVPGTDIPVPDDYRLGPGDQMSVQLYGQTTQIYTLPVSRDGFVSMPELGPINVGGLGFGAARGLIESRVNKQMIGTQARVTLSDLRSARVLVLGDAEHPGTYVVSGLSTATTALFASGGVKPIGSLRKIEIKRDGKLLKTLDLYDVLLKGNTASDLRLQTGDVVFIPPVGPTVSIDGEIRRPATYELHGEKTVWGFLEVAGGLTPSADLSAVTIERIETGKARQVFSLDLNTAAGRNTPLHAGDVVYLPPIRTVVDNEITLEGRVRRPGTFAYRDGLRITDVLRSVDDLAAQADLHYVLIRRQDIASGRVSVFSVDIEAALAARGTAADLKLAPRDRISVFDLVSPRGTVIDPLVEELNRQASPGQPASTVDVVGEVHAPGHYPLEPGMRVSDALRAGGGLKDAAYSVSAELTRYQVTGGERRVSKITNVELAAILKGDNASDIALQPYDLLTVKQTPDWTKVEEVELVGEVKFPGHYRIRRGETLASVFKRAGGLTNFAFAKGTIFMREELKVREQEQIDRLATRLQSQLTTTQAAVAASDKGASAAAGGAAAAALVAQLRSTKPVGRLVVDIPALLRQGEGSDVDVTLHNSDRIYVPRETQEVTVLGEVQNPTSHLFRRGMTSATAIALSGGYSEGADKKRAYVIRADGSVALAPEGWFAGKQVPLQAGDSVVVPIDAQKLPPLMEWSTVSSILSNLVVATSGLKFIGLL